MAARPSHWQQTLFANEAHASVRPGVRFSCCGVVGRGHASHSRRGSLVTPRQPRLAPPVLQPLWHRAWCSVWHVACGATIAASRLVGADRPSWLRYLVACMYPLEPSLTTVAEHRCCFVCCRADHRVPRTVATAPPINGSPELAMPLHRKRGGGDTLQRLDRHGSYGTVWRPRPSQRCSRARTRLQRSRSHTVRCVHITTRAGGCRTDSKHWVRHSSWLSRRPLGWDVANVARTGMGSFWHSLFDA
jgi:hypothetical protein